MRIPLSKVEIDDDMRAIAIKALDSGHYILGKYTKEFEERFAKFCGVNYAVSTSSGTAAIFLALLALGISSRNEVIVPSFSFIATATPILMVGGKPIFTEVNPRTYTLDPKDVKRRITRRTRAIMAVHLFGHPAEMDEISEIAERNGLLVIEDACQAHGAEYKGRRVGSLGIAGCFSFYPSKNMTVCGDGGMVTTDDLGLAEKIRMLRDHGRKEKYIHERVGYNLRFNEVQAAIGMKQLGKLQQWNEKRRQLAEIYTAHLEDLVVTPVEEKWSKRVYYMYVVRTRMRNELQTFLHNCGVATGIHYPIPIHQQPAITESLGAQPSLKFTEELSSSVLSLPIYPSLGEEKVEWICDNIEKYFAANPTARFRSTRTNVA